MQSVAAASEHFLKQHKGTFASFFFFFSSVCSPLFVEFKATSRHCLRFTLPQQDDASKKVFKYFFETKVKLIFEHEKNKIK